MKKFIALLMATLLIVACFAGCGAKEAIIESIVVGYTIFAPMNYMD